MTPRHLLLNRARTRMIGASDAGIKLVLHDVLDQFFNESNSWVEDISLAVAPNVLTYTVVLAEVPSGQVMRLSGVIDNNRVVQPAIMSLDFTTIVLRDPVSSAQTFTASLIKTVRPEDCDDNLMPVAPDWVFQKYYRTLLAGILGKMMMEDGKPYTNQALGVLQLKDFTAGIAKARVAAAHRNTFGVNAWVFPGGWSSRTQRGGVSSGNTHSF